MNNEGFLRIDRLLSLLGLAVSPVMLLLFEGGAASPYRYWALIALAAAALIAEAGHIADRAGLEYSFPRFSAPLIFLAAFSALSLLWSSDKGQTALKLAEVFMYLLAFWAASRAVPKARRSVLFIFLTLSAAILGWFLINYATAANPEDLNPFLPFQQSGSFMAFAVVLLSVSLGVLLTVVVDGAVLSQRASAQTRAAVAFISILAGAVASCALLLSASQTYLLIGVAAILIVALTRIRRGLAASAAVIAAVLGLGLLASWLLTLPMKGASVTFLPAFAKDARGLADELGYLSYHWISALKLGIKAPFWGFGPGSFKDAVSLVFTPTGFKPGVDAQSFALQLFAELGLPGIIAFLGFAAAALVSLIRTSREDDVDSLMVLAPFMVLILVMFVGGSHGAPLINLLLFIIGGFASSSDPISFGLTGRRRSLPFVVIPLAAAASVLIGIVAIRYEPLKEEAEHHRAHEEYEEAAGELEKAIALMPLDAQLFIDMADTEAVLAMRGASGRSLEEALDYAKRATILAKYDPSAYEIRGAIRRAISLDSPWLDDYKLAAKFSGAAVVHDLQITEWGLLNGRADVAAEYVEIAKGKLPALKDGAAMTVDGIQDLTDIIRILAADYAVAVKTGDEQRRAQAAEALIEVEGEYSAAHEFVHQIIAAYGVEDSIH